MSFGWNKDGSKLIILTYVSYGRHVAMKSIEPYIPNHLVLEGIKDRSKLVIGICIYIYAVAQNPFPFFWYCSPLRLLVWSGAVSAAPSDGAAVL